MVKILKAPAVSIVITNRNGKKFLDRCFQSLNQVDYERQKLQFIMVDNCSTDGSYEYVKKAFPYVQILQNDTNNYCKANNIGIKFSEGEYVALLNNDTYVHRNWVKELVSAIQRDDRVGCSGSKVLFPDGRIQTVGHYEFPNFYWGDKGLREPDIGQYDFTKEVSSLSGASVLFKRQCLEDVGYLDEDFVMYMEDIDMFLRCRQKGWKLIYAPKSIVYHEFHGTANEDTINYYIERNRLLLIAKHFPHKFADELCGKGNYLMDSNRKVLDDIYSILPEAFSKFLEHHGVKTFQIIMPNVFENLKKIENIKKDSIVQALSSEKESLTKQLEQNEIISTEHKNLLADIKEQLVRERLEKESIEKLKGIADRALEKIGENIKNKVIELEIKKEEVIQKSKMMDSMVLERESAGKSLDEYRKMVFEKDAMIEKLLIDKNELETQFRRQVEQYLSEKAVLDLKISQLSERCIKDEVVLSDRERELNYRQGLIQDLTQQAAFSKEETDAMKEQNRLLSIELDRLKQIETEKEQVITEKESLLSQIELLRREKIDIERKFNSEREAHDKEVLIKMNLLSNEIALLKNEKLESEVKFSIEKENYLNDANIQIGRMAEEIETLRNDLMKRVIEIEGRKKVTNELEVKIMEMQEGMSALMQEKNGMHILLKNMDIKHQHLVCQLEAFKDNISQLDMELHAVSDKNINLENKLSDAAGFIHNKDRELKCCADKISELQAEINRIFNSETYRFVCRPLWALLDVVKLRSRGLRSFMAHPYKNALFYLVVVLVVVFIAIPLKIKKIFKI